jgi:protein-S-isoprenylcysteine O-methyltransferase Ste14
MDESTYKLLLLALLLGFFIVRSRYVAGPKKAEKVSAKGLGDRLLVALNWAGMVFFPLAYIATSLLDPMAMDLPEAVRFAGGLLYAAALLLILWSHRHLGSNWSMVLKIKKEHALVDTGPYRHIRHPMYLAFYAMMFAQLLISSNWLVGGFGLAAWTLLYLFRVPMEERLLEEEFGDGYRRYKEKTGRIVPRLRLYAEARNK